MGCISLKFFCCNHYNIFRGLIGLLILCFVFICILYGFGQITDLELNDFFCPERTLNDIRELNKKYNLPKGDINQNNTQLGSCYSTDNILVNYDVLYNQNSVAFKGEWSFTPSNILKAISFFLLSSILFIIFVLELKSFIQDFLAIKYNYWSKAWSDNNNCCKTKCSCIQCNLKDICQGKSGCVAKIYNSFQHCVAKIYNSCQQDEFGWITQKQCFEIYEIGIQFIALLSYGGSQNNITNANNEDGKISMAEAPGVVIGFTIVLFSNCIVTGILWMFYLFKHNICQGGYFNTILTFVDSIFDTIYAIFPLIIIVDKLIKIGNDRSKISYSYGGLKTIAGTLNTNTTSTFFATFISLIFVVTKTREMKDILRRYAIKKWKKSLKTKNKNIIKTNITEIDDNTPTLTSIPMRTLVDTKYKGFPMSKLQSIDSLDHDNTLTNSYKFCVILFAILCIAIGGLIIILVMLHFNHNIKQCNINKYNDKYPHLMLYNKYCKYKVYPFFEDKYPCQCRIFFMHSNDIIQFFNNNNDMTINMFEKSIQNILDSYYMLEALNINSDTHAEGQNAIASEISLKLNKNAMKSKNLRILSLSLFNITYFDPDFGKYWNNLEYIELRELNLNNGNIFDGITEVQYLNIPFNQLKNIDFICNFKKLRVLQLHGNPLESLPDCMFDNLVELEIINMGLISIFDIRFFTLPLVEVFGYGNGYEIDINNTVRLDVNKLNYKGKYYLQRSKICEYYIESSNIFNNNSKLNHFIKQVNACDNVCNPFNFFCNPKWPGNGVCDEPCNNPECNYDGFDCIQLCSCNTDLIGNGICNEECNVPECDYDKCDCGKCANNTNITTLCERYTDCNSTWLGDTLCDMNCMNDLCQNDFGDCDSCPTDETECGQGWYAFSTVAGDDYLVDTTEVCNYWTIIQLYHNVRYGDDSNSINCTDIVRIYDLNGDNKLNAYEAFLYFIGDRALQVNCSLCALDPTVYYK